ncbi:MAG: hypothetical protein GY822_24370 [Deltaproteobacteria bacterium]|nr:hypothetical protein [Deltaproteobacteria bacterium]
MSVLQRPVSPATSSAIFGIRPRGAFVMGVFCLSLPVLFLSPKAYCQTGLESPSSSKLPSKAESLTESEKKSSLKASEVEEIIPTPVMKPAVESGEFRCPADNPAWWQEAKEGGWEGYGETWDLHTCEEGNQFFFPGTVGRWRPYLRPIVMNVRPSGKPIDVEFYSVLLPTVAFGSIGLVAFLAWLLAMFTRKKKLALVEVPCPSCGLTVPVAVDEKKEKTLFCPGCGGASFVVKGHGKKAEVEVHILHKSSSEMTSVEENPTKEDPKS